MSDTTWTALDVEALLIEAARTIKRLPSGEWARLAQLRVSWPSYVHDRRIVYGWESARTPRMQPTTEEIGRMDQAIDWMATHCAPASIDEKRDRLPQDIALVLWWRAAHLTWEKIAQARFRLWGVNRSQGGPSPIPMGNSPPSLRRIHRAGLALVARRLEAAGAPNPLHAADQQEAHEPASRRAPPQYQPRVHVAYDTTDRGTGTPTTARAQVLSGRKPLVIPPSNEGDES